MLSCEELHQRVSATCERHLEELATICAQVRHGSPLSIISDAWMVSIELAIADPS